MNLAGALQFTGTLHATPFTINANGALNIGNATAGAAAAGSISGLTTLSNNGVIRFNQSDAAYTFGIEITGTGQLVHNAAGTTTLTGSNSYSGGTAINAGTLVAAHNNALGLGVVSVQGAGRLLVGSGIAISNSLQLGSGGTLAGTGTVGSAGTTTMVQSGATLAPGDASTPYGTLTVNGNLAFAAGSTLQVQANPDGSSASAVHVTGTAALAGQVLHVGPKSNFAVATTYTILTADQGVNGTFISAGSSYAFLTATLGYTPNSVTLTLQGVEDFGRRVNTANQQAVARNIQALGSSNPVYQHLVQAEDSQAAAMANSLSGDAHAGVQGSLGGLSGFAPSVSGQHIGSSLRAGMHPGAAVAQSDGPLPASAWPSSKALPAWAEVVGHWQRYDGDGNAATLKQRTSGLFLGMDQEVGNSGWRLGGSLGYTNADGKVADRASESDVNSYSAAVYGGKSFGTGVGPRINVLGGLAYTWHDIETTRRVSSLGQTLKADYSAHTAQLFAEVGYAIGQYDQFGFEPFVGVSLGQQRTGSFQERGGFAALSGQSNTDDLASTTLGLRVHSDFQVAGKDARLRATVGWRHALGNVAAERTMAFEGGQNFTVAGAPLARNTAVLGLEGEVALSRTAALVLGYRGELGSSQRDHAANVKLRWSF